MKKKYQEFIYWYIGNHKIHTNDVCYIYYSNLPDGSSRILFRGLVFDSDLDHDNNESICPDGDENQKYIKLKIKSISLENNETFNFYNLCNRYNLISMGQFSYLHIDSKEHKKLIDDVEKYNNNCHPLKYVYEYFDNNYCICEFGCKTFVGGNGFHYVEKHHLVEKKLINKYIDVQDINSLINNKNNLFNLCTMCYKKIHHAKKDVRKKMIEYLYNRNKNYFDNSFNKIHREEDVLTWLYEIYKCK
jgi:hypothetical protein